jgi:transposase
MYRYDLTDAQWDAIRAFFPDRFHHGQAGHPWQDHRPLVNGILWHLHSGAPWPDTPERYGPWKTVDDRFHRWRKDGTWAKILDALLLRVDDAGLIDRDLWIDRNRLGLIRGLDILRLLLEDRVGRLPILGACRLGQGATQAAALGDGGQAGPDKGGADGESGAGGLALNAAEAEAGLSGSAVVLEGVTSGQGFGAQLGAVAEGLVEPGAKASGVSDNVALDVLADGQADRRTRAGQGSPPRCAVYSKGDSWPFSSSRLLDVCLHFHTHPTIRDGQFVVAEI